MQLMQQNGVGHQLNLSQSPDTDARLQYAPPQVKGENNP